MKKTKYSPMYEVIVTGKKTVTLRTKESFCSYIARLTKAKVSSVHNAYKAICDHNRKSDKIFLIKVRRVAPVAPNILVQVSRAQAV